MRTWPIGDNRILMMYRQKYSDGKKPSVTYVNVHQNELTSIEAASMMLDSFGGEFWRLTSRDSQRLIRFYLDETGKVYTFDPNRIFTESGCEKTLQENGPCDLESYLMVREFANVFVELLLGSGNLVVAVHNNKGEEYCAQAYLPGQQLARDCAQINLGLGIDPHDFIFTTDLAIYEYLANVGLNVVLQDNQQAQDDGSLSVFCGRHGIPYVNVEAKVDHLGEQLAMLQLLQHTSRV